MTDRDQTLEAVAQAIHAYDLARGYTGNPEPDGQTRAQAQAAVDALTGLGALMPDEADKLRAEVERTVLIEAGQKLRDWVGGTPQADWTDGQRVFARHLLIAARHIEPKLADDERQAAVDEARYGSTAPDDKCPACRRGVHRDWVDAESALHGPKKIKGRWRCVTPGCRWNPDPIDLDKAKITVTKLHGWRPISWELLDDESPAFAERIPEQHRQHQFAIREPDFDLWHCATCDTSGELTGAQP